MIRIVRQVVGVGLGTVALLAAQGPAAPKAEEGTQWCSGEGELIRAWTGAYIPSTLTDIEEGLSVKLPGLFGPS